MKKALSDGAIVAALRSGTPNPLTLKTYLSRLERLKRQLGMSEIASILSDPGRAVPLLRRNARTATNAVTTVLAVFKHCPAALRGMRAQHAAWSAFHGELRQADDDRYSHNLPVNERQEANYVGIDEVERRLGELTAAAWQVKGAKQSMATLLMAFYTYLTPKRSDLGALRVYRVAAHHTPHPPVFGDDPGNFVVLSTTKGLLVIRRHKTKKEIIEEMPSQLVELLDQSMVLYPRTHVFVDRSGRPFSNNGYTKYVIRTFAAHFDGRAAGTSLLRHAYVSERIDFNNMSLAERKEIARLMGHSTDMQATVYKWVGRRRGVSSVLRRRRPASAAPLHPIVCPICFSEFEGHVEYDRHMSERHTKGSLDAKLS